MTVNSSANSIILILFAFSDNLSAENSKLSAESGLPGLSLLESIWRVYVRPRAQGWEMSIFWKVHLYWTYTANNWGICVSLRVCVRPLGAGLVNVHFPEYIFVLDITLPTFGEYVSVGGCLCALWRSFGEYAFPKKPASEGNTETIQLTNIPNCLHNKYQFIMLQNDIKNIMYKIDFIIPPNWWIITGPTGPLFLVISIKNISLSQKKDSHCW